ncbi:MAG: hypothetical protein GXP16_04860 [Gammaproteobacteria bacterium]|nr:hypothetical protein [Gammaproteobacteria bacterium]
MFETLNCYLVGGAVRDELLGRPVHDRDWVVVGSTVEEMLRLGFVQVGKDFPVFLHPITHEEYALARTERKQGVGHTGFVVDAHPSVTLRQDLKRRDLTVNAIAKSVDGILFDPYGGQQDLQAKCLRHVSAAFGEDPLRVFRVARFAAQLVGFRVAQSTLNIMSAMTEAGELESLSAQRVWVEFEKALAAPNPQEFIAILKRCGGLEPWLVELNDVPAKFSSGSSVDRFVQLQMPLQNIETLCNRLKCPGRFQQAATDYSAYAETVTRWREVDPQQLLDTLLALRVNHASARLEALARVVSSIRDVDVAEVLILAKEFGGLALASEPGMKGLQGKAFGQALRALQLQWLTTYLSR